MARGPYPLVSVVDEVITFDPPGGSMVPSAPVQYPRHDRLTQVRDSMVAVVKASRGKKLEGHDLRRQEERVRVARERLAVLRKELEDTEALVDMADETVRVCS